MRRRLLERVALLSPRDHETPAPELEGALRLLGWSVDAATYRQVTDGILVAVAVIGSLATLVTPGFRLPVLVATLCLLFVVKEAARLAPRLLASTVRRRALGAAPWLVCRAAMRLHVTPTVEASAAFAARDPEGALEQSLAAAVRRSRGSETRAFDAFLDEWGERFSPLRRGLGLIVAAAGAPTAERDRGIDRALETVLDGFEERAASDAAALRGPVTAVYAFGVLLPLAFVAALPAARLAGLPVSVPVVVLGYDVVLPLGLVAATGWLLSNRPVAFPATRIPADHPEVPTRRWLAAVAGLTVGWCTLLAVPSLLSSWLAPLAAVGFGVGTTATLYFRPYRAVRQEVRAVEDDLPDVLYAVGRKVADGTPVETALPEAASELDSPASEQFGESAERAAALGVGIEAALLGPHGGLDARPSRRTRDAARLLADAAREGKPAGGALVAAADHLSRLARVETRTRRSLRRVTGTMANTAAVFAPLVGGVTVALAGRMTDSALGEAVPQASLGLAVGGYVLLLAALLTALSSGLERGFDRALVGYRVGLALLAATATYLAATVLGALVV